MRLRDTGCSAWRSRGRAAAWFFLLFFLLSVFFRECLFICYVPTGSMAPAVSPGTVLVGIRQWLCAAPEKGDIVAVQMNDRLLVKRVAGTAGDRIEMREGKAYVNGVLFPWGEGKCPGEFLGPYLVPAGHVFLLGDHRTESWDARYWEEPYTPVKAVWGKVLAR